MAIEFDSTWLTKFYNTRTMKTGSNPPIIPAVGIRFELFYGLYRCFEARRPEWLPAPSACVEDGFAGLGRWPYAWIGIADTVAGAEAEAGFEQLEAALGGLDAAEFARRWLTSHLHDREVAAALVARTSTLGEAIARLPAKKREWLAHVGLYPLRREAPGLVLLQRLIDDPTAVQAKVRAILTDFWTGGFRDFWQILRPAAAARCRRLEVLLASAPPAAVFERLGLRAEYDDDARELRAVRGGYRIALDDIQAIYVLPSAVNEGRFWTVECADRPGERRVWFPWYDDSLGPEIGPPVAAAVPEPDLDLVFRALGDGTRWAILSLLAERPMTPSELADVLGIARSTVSHHLFLLREAALVAPTTAGRAPVALSRQAFARLSARTLKRFFPDDGAAA